MESIMLLMICTITAATTIHNERIIVADSESSNLITNIDVDRHSKEPDSLEIDTLPTTTEELLRELHQFANGVVANGWPQFGIPPLNPLILDDYHLKIPAGFLNLDLQLKGIYVAGFETFIIYRSELNMKDLSLDVDIGYPTFDIRADEYDLVGDVFPAIPLYGKGNAKFKVDEFRFHAKLYLKQSANRNSVIIDRIESASFTIPSIKSNLQGMLGGGDVDAIVNAIVEEVIIDYLNKFHVPIANIISEFAIDFGNPRLEQFDTWEYIAAIHH